LYYQGVDLNREKGAAGKQDQVDVREHTVSRDGDASEELVELFVVAHGKLHVARDDACLLVVAGGVAGELEDLSSKVLKHSSKVHGRASVDAQGVLALLEEAVHTASLSLFFFLSFSLSPFQCLLLASILNEF